MGRSKTPSGSWLFSKVRARSSVNFHVWVMSERRRYSSAAMRAAVISAATSMSSSVVSIFAQVLASSWLSGSLDGPLVKVRLWRATRDMLLDRAADDRYRTVGGFG